MYVKWVKAIILDPTIRNWMVMWTEVMDKGTRRTMVRSYLFSYNTGRESFILIAKKGEET